MVVTHSGGSLLADEPPPPFMPDAPVPPLPLPESATPESMAELVPARPPVPAPLRPPVAPVALAPPALEPLALRPPAPVPPVPPVRPPTPVLVPPAPEIGPPSSKKSKRSGFFKSPAQLQQHTSVNNHRQSRRTQRPFAGPRRIHEHKRQSASMHTSSGRALEFAGPSALFQARRCMPMYSRTRALAKEAQKIAGPRETCAHASDRDVVFAVPRIPTHREHARRTCGAGVAVVLEIVEMTL